ncbi:MAG: 50S ribosome-binding GTPase [Candidatus Aenigmarchaeota archaeon]|nr:50S ribosome-binding GTPase [Candidatus Aenigmarchaeota archaeon]MCK5452350.1 50S ribosome-binding GTPase [Candidatus Aenigmarchaeota archaeon]
MGINWNCVIHTLKSSDLVLEIVDARAPFSTRSEKLEKVIEKLGKSLVIVMNKRDLAPENLVEESHKKILESVPCIFVSAKERRDIPHLRKMINVHTPKSDNIRVCVVGYPNTGKSSIINVLAGKHVAGVAPVPGHTRGEQWVRISSKVMLLDTPGVIPWDEDISIEKGFGRPDKMKDIEDSVEDFIERLAKAKYSNIKELYGLSDEDLASGDVVGILAEKRGLLIKGGRPDLKRVSQRVVLDWNTGKIHAFVD